MYKRKNCCLYVHFKLFRNKGNAIYNNLDKNINSTYVITMRIIIPHYTLELSIISIKRIISIDETYNIYCKYSGKK